MGVLNRLAGALAQVVSPIYILRAPLLASGLSVAILAYPGQTFEIYRAYALDRAHKWPQIALALTTLTLAAVLIWFIGRNLTLRWQADDMTVKNASGVLLRWMPRLLGAAPLVGAGLGLLQAGRGLRKIDLPAWFEAQMPGLLKTLQDAAAAHAATQQVLYVGAGICFALALLLLVLTFLRSYGKSYKYQSPNPWLFSVPARVVVYVIILAFVTVFSAFSVGALGTNGLLAEQIGSFAIFNVFLICLAFLLSFLTNVYDRTQFPALSILVIVGLLATAFDLNDNHTIRTLKVNTFRPLPSATKAFRDWLESRPDRAYFRQVGQPYPVVIVAAEGGGLYAAQHAAASLGRFQDRCPAFAQHVFTISGVSGGGLGAGLFASLARERAKPQATPECAFGDQPAGWYEQMAMAYLSRDFLAPIAATGLFPDFLQRFIPYPIPEFDRARALEAAFERAWVDILPKAKDNPMARSYYDLWTPEAVWPSVVLTTTQVQTGRRVLISPFRFYKDTTVQLPTLNTKIRADIALSTAIGISARFPWVLPVASWRERRTEQLRFVDGGYFEDSGVETAVDLAVVLEDLERDLKESGQPGLDFQIHLLTLSPDNILTEPVNSLQIPAMREEETKRRGFDELFSPIKTMLNTRWSRGVAAVARAFDRYCPGCFRETKDRRFYPGLDGFARMLRINFTDFELTLGWQLSRISQSLVLMHSAYPDRCIATRPSVVEQGKWPWAARVFNENNCSACKLLYTISGRLKELDGLAPTVSQAPTVEQSSLQVARARPNFLKLCRALGSNDAQPTYHVPAPP